MASGAAVRGAYTRPIRYPEQLVVMVSEETVDELERMARIDGVTKSEAARCVLAPGFAITQLAERHGVTTRELVDAAKLWAEAAIDAKDSTIVIEP